jgi:DNA-binding transcriptional MocR family regulator
MSALKQYTTNARSAAALVADVESAVAAGTLLAGERLPSVRRLADGAGLSPATVAAAFAELRRRGVVVSEPRRGTRIGGRPPLPAPAALAVPAGARDLSRGNPDPALLPDLAAALRRTPQPVHLYGDAPEDDELLSRARAALRADGVPEDHVCVVSGALDGIERVLSVRLRPGDRVAVEEPGYAALFDLLRAQGLGLEPVDVDEKGMLPDRLETAMRRGAHAVVVTPRGQNPTGAALDAARAEALRGVLAAHPETLLVEDDHLGPVAGAPLHTLAGAGGPWAATRSVAKALGPDLRLAILAGDEATVARVRGRQLCGPGWVSHVLQRVVATLWADGEARAQVARARELYVERRERLLEALAAHGVQAHGASGLNVWVPVGDEGAVTAALLSRGWVVAPGGRYRTAPGGGAVRVTTAALKAGEAERLASDLAAVVAPAAGVRSG